MLEGLLKKILDKLLGTIEVVQSSIARTITGSVNVTQNAKDRTITGNVNVTQDAKDRTITGTVTVSGTVDLSAFDVFLSSVRTLTIASTAYKLPASPQANREMLAVYNETGENIYIGGSSVTTANGFTVKDGKYFITSASNNVYACCGTAGKTVRLLECK